MSSGHPSRRLQRARSEMTHRRTSMDSMRSEFRSRFLDRLRSTRSKSVDRHRLLTIVENYDDTTQYTSLNELRKVLLADKETTDLINSEDVGDLLKEVEDELRQVSLQYEAEKYADENQKETEDTVDRLMSKCQVCQKLSTESVCPNCNTQLTNEFQ